MEKGDAQLIISSLITLTAIGLFYYYVPSKIAVIFSLVSILSMHLSREW